jgi:hypothetical protein
LIAPSISATNTNARIGTARSGAVVLDEQRQTGTPEALLVVGDLLDPRIPMAEPVRSGDLSLFSAARERSLRRDAEADGTSPNRKEPLQW